MLHEPVSTGGKDYAVAYKMKLGGIMFLIYAAVYLGFILINITLPQAMESTVLFGLNLAVVYGFGLIVFALLLAVIYNTMCSRRECREAGVDTSDGGTK